MKTKTQETIYVNIPEEDENKETILENITSAILSICDDIEQTRAEENKDRAEAIKMLCEAYNLMKRGVLK